LQSYSWSEFGREAEFVVALYLKSRGWSVSLSKGSKGPADITAVLGDALWFIQVKASSKSARLKGYEVKRLNEMAESNGGLAVVAILQPASRYSSIILGRYGITFYQLQNWQSIRP
jgi:Holliday junction resolvase